MPTKLTIAIAGLSFAATLLFIAGKLGTGGEFLGWSVMMAFPYLACALLGLAFRNQKNERWIIFVATTLCAALGFYGIYAAFYSGAPVDPWKVIFQPIYQILLVGLCAGVAGFSLLVRKSTLARNSKLKRPNNTPQTTTRSSAPDRV